MSNLAYFMLFHTSPVPVSQRLEKLQRDFLWSDIGKGDYNTPWIGGW